MGFYDLGLTERKELVATIYNDVYGGIQHQKLADIERYFSDEDTYIRKTAYVAVGKIFKTDKGLLQKIKAVQSILYKEEDFKIRQTVVNAAGEIGKTDFETVRHYFDEALFDQHHAVRNAVIGSMKKMGQVNPVPVLQWAAQYLDHPDKEIRREICHGIELRGRTHPEDILPLLQRLEFDTTARVSNTLVHVIGQIAYKKGCLEKVAEHLLHWENKELVAKAIEEIIDVHHRYRDFSFYAQEQAIRYLQTRYSL